MQFIKGVLNEPIILRAWDEILFFSVDLFMNSTYSCFKN
jgi:hypothetical protein